MKEAILETKFCINKLFFIILSRSIYFIINYFVICLQHSNKYTNILL